MIRVRQFGEVKLRLRPTGQPITLKRVLYVPEFKINIISQGQLVQKGVVVLSRQEGCTLYYEGKVLTKGVLLRNNLIQIHTQVETVYISTSKENWH